MKKYDYAVISSDTKPKLEKEVIRVLGMGYQLAGGVCVAAASSDYIEYFQAVIKEYDD